MNSSTVWNSITRGYGICTEGGSDVRVHVEPNMFWTDFYEENMDTTLLSINEKTIVSNKWYQCNLLKQKGLKKISLKKRQDSSNRKQYKAISNQWKAMDYTKNYTGTNWVQRLASGADWTRKKADWRISGKW